MKLCHVYLCQSGRSFDRPYTYLVPEGMEAKSGMLCEVPFGKGNSARRAYIAEVLEQESMPEYPLKPLSALLSPPMLRKDQFELALEMRRRYFCSTGQALQIMVPPRVSLAGSKKQRFVRLLKREEALMMLEEGELRSLGQIRVLQYLLDEEEASVQDLKVGLDVSLAVINGLRKHGLIEYYTADIKRETEQSLQLEKPKELCLNDEQEEALARIRRLNPASAPNGLAEALLFGVTGSGKTEVYLRAAEDVLSRGRDVLILVPEISLTPLLCNRIENRFGKSAAVLHSRLSPGKRYDQWRSILEGEKRLVVGARSAVFAPLADIGLIIIDEEQESSYKSESTPRYQTSEVARLRAVMHGAALVLASATPSVESFYRVEAQKAELISLKKRAAGNALPETRIIDMRTEIAAGNRSLLSRELERELDACFARGEQAMIFLNRRGVSTSLLCRECGADIRCENCDVSMKEHRNPLGTKGAENHLLICHLCGSVRAKPDCCPHCGSRQIAPFGVGTQQAEAVLQKRFPGVRFLRMDQDTTARKNGHAQILEQFASGQADCLIGTQMIAKGHDFGRVTLVGMIAADLLLSADSFQAEERAFQLICQAAGRAGRSDLPGLVLIQTFHPENPVLKAAARQDYASFYQMERSKRERLEFPPFFSLGMAVFSSDSEKKCREAAGAAFAWLEMKLKAHPDEPFKLYEVQRAPISRIRRKWRYRIVFKSGRKEFATSVLTALNERALPEGVHISTDLNPTHMM